METLYRIPIYEKIENLVIKWDTLYVEFKWWKSILLSTEKNLWDWDVYLDFSTIEFYKDNLLSQWRIDELEIKIVEWEWILLCIWASKIFIPWYHNSVYYSSDMTLVVEFSDWVNKKTDKFDMEKWVYNFS